MSDIEKRCVECGTEVPTISETPLCSKSCQTDYAHRMVRNMDSDDAWCPTCHKEFDSIMRVCYHHNQSHSFDLYRTEICENCDKVFRPSSSTNEMKYCSEECFGQDKRVELASTDCNNCGETFKHQPSKERKFCSTSCSTSKSFHWNWSGGTANTRNSTEYRAWRESIHQKYDACQSCGSVDNLHAHHIVPVSEDKQLATDKDNGVLLCGDCHSNEHPDLPERIFVRN